MRPLLFLFVITIGFQTDRNNQSANAQSASSVALTQDAAKATASQPSDGSLYFDAFSDVSGSLIRFKNGLMQTERSEKTRDIYPYANNSRDPILLEVMEDSESLGADGKPGVLALSWQSTPKTLEYSGFVYLGKPSRICLPRVAEAKTKVALDSFHLRFRYKGKNEGNVKVNFKVACRFEPGLGDAYKSRIEMPAITVTDQWQSFSMRLTRGSNVREYLKTAAKASPNENQFKIAWNQVGPISGYRVGDTLLIDDLEIVESKDPMQNDNSAGSMDDKLIAMPQGSPYQTVAGLNPIDLSKQFQYPASQFENATSFPWPVVPQGAINILDVPFQIAGAIMFWGKENADRGMLFAEAVRDIKCQQSFESLYVLHGGFFKSDAGMPVLDVIFRYKNGDSHSDTMVYGGDVIDWYVKSDVKSQAPTSKRSLLAWVAQGTANGVPQRISLGMTEISNPRPDQIVESIDIVSSKGQTAGFVMGMTVGKAGKMIAKLRVRPEDTRMDLEQARASSIPTEQQKTKEVKLSWFPRFSPDGKWLLSAHGGWEQGQPGEIRMWDVSTGKAKHVLGHSRGIRSVDWSPTGNFFASGAFGGTLRLFRSEDAKSIAEIELGETVEGVRISADEKRIITTLGNGEVGIFTIPKLRQAYRFRRIQEGEIWGMAVSTKGKLLATAGPDKHVRIVDLDSHQVLHELVHPDETNGVAFSRDDKHLATGCSDGLIRVFDVEKGEQTGTLNGHERGSVTDLQFSDDGKTLVSSGMDTTVRVWDVSSLEKPVLKSTLRNHKGIVFGVALSPLGDCLASAGWDDRLVLWDLNDGTERWSWKR